MLQINCINLDAHADYRPLEEELRQCLPVCGRRWLPQKYCIIGLRELPAAKQLDR